MMNVEIFQCLETNVLPRNLSSHPNPESSLGLRDVHNTNKAICSCHLNK